MKRLFALASVLLFTLPSKAALMLILIAASDFNYNNYHYYHRRPYYRTYHYYYVVVPVGAYVATNSLVPALILLDDKSYPGGVETVLSGELPFLGQDVVSAQKISSLVAEAMQTKLLATDTTGEFSLSLNSDQMQNLRAILLEADYSENQKAEIKNLLE